MNTFDSIATHFHFLRPGWLFALLPLVLMAIVLWYQKRSAQQWQQLIAPELLPYLLDGQTTRIKPWQFIALLLAWLISCIALAGPSWEKRPMPVEQNQQALVMMLDLSPSMMSEDLKPSRLVRARLKIADILRERRDGQTALLVYAGDVHVVAPLTDDTETINNIIPALHPSIMPAQGSNTEAAVSRALQLLKDSGVTQGDLLLITDGVDDEAGYNVREIMNRAPDYRLSILGVGGDTPTPIPSSKGGFVRDSQRNIVTTYLNADSLQQLATETRGRYRTLSNTRRDIDALLDVPPPTPGDTQRVEREFDSWYDRGHWLVLLLLPIVLYSFRRGIFLSLLVVPLIGFTPAPSYALTWDDLWKNNNQQAYEKLQQQDAAGAAQQFTHPEWKASAEYRAGNYEAAAKGFVGVDTPSGHYNRGNALAKANQLAEAIKAYDKALALDPSLEDAKKNRQRVEELLKQQQEQQQNQEGQDNQDSEDKEQGQQDQNKEQNQDSQGDSQPQDEDGAADDKENSSPQDSPEEGDTENKPQDQSSSSPAQETEDDSSESTSSEQQEAADSTQDEQQEQKIAEDEAGQEETEQSASLHPPAEDEMSEEERQAMEQWLRRVPDDPGGLLRNKFKYEYYKRNQDIRNGDWTPPDNGAENRW